MKYYNCVECRAPFSYKNVFTHLGAKETQISGLCELCWELLTDYEDDDTYEPDVDETNYDPYSGCDVYEVNDIGSEFDEPF